MKKMSDVFNLPLQPDATRNGEPCLSDRVWRNVGAMQSDVKDLYAAHAINMHDELVSALEEARVYVEEQEYINGYDRIFLHKIDSLLERCK